MSLRGKGPLLIFQLPKQYHMRKTVCSALYPPTQYANLPIHDKEEEIRLCKLPCSAQELGPIDDASLYDVTLPMRERCRSRCEIDGPDRSIMCLSYCMSFPDDNGTFGLALIK